MVFEKSQNHDKLLEKIFQNIHLSKLHLEHTHWRKLFLQLLLLKVCELFRFGHVKKLEEVYFGLYESSLHF